MLSTRSSKVASLFWVDCFFRVLLAICLRSSSSSALRFDTSSTIFSRLTSSRPSSFCFFLFVLQFLVFRTVHRFVAQVAGLLGNGAGYIAGELLEAEMAVKVFEVVFLQPPVEDQPHRGLDADDGV